MTETGWDHSAPARLAKQDAVGDWRRRPVLDRKMLDRALAARPAAALDVGCGEGRLCRMLAAHGIARTGIEPTARPREAAVARHPEGRHLVARAGDLPFPAGVHDLFVSYLTLIDIPDSAAIGQMARVPGPRCTLLVANLASFDTPAAASGWTRTPDGRAVCPVDNWHRPLCAYMRALSGQGLQPSFFDEPSPHGCPPEDAGKADRYRLVPCFPIMEWTKPGVTHVS